MSKDIVDVFSWIDVSMSKAVQEGMNNFTSTDILMLEHAAEQLAWLAGYLDVRITVGEDSVHEDAVRAANRTGRVVWERAFGHAKYFARPAHVIQPPTLRRR